MKSAGRGAYMYAHTARYFFFLQRLWSVLLCVPSGKGVGTQVGLEGHCCARSEQITWLREWAAVLYCQCVWSVTAWWLALAVDQTVPVCLAIMHARPDCLLTSKGLQRIQHWHCGISNSPSLAGQILEACMTDCRLHRGGSRGWLKLVMGCSDPWTAQSQCPCTAHALLAARGHGSKRWASFISAAHVHVTIDSDVKGITRTKTKIKHEYKTRCHKTKTKNRSLSL